MTPVTCTVRDETTAGDVLHALELQLASETLDVGALIEARVNQEVRAHNGAPSEPFAGLVEPVARETAANGTRPVARIDAGRQVAVAKEAFLRGRVLILVDDRQVTELDERVTLRPGGHVTFLKLVPIVGG
ncbi:MAG TPA: hypothetical protein VNA28_11950 [Solirubrobacteraceae bacterium]|nr:hypothetical protein [Solirubrobacteraceae bacterium]